MAARTTTFSICHQCLRNAMRRTGRTAAIRNLGPSRAGFSSTSSTSAASPSQSPSQGGRNGKPIVLEQPDKFRPPSHPARLNRRAPRAYNQGTTREEKEQQKTRSYPHMFPDEGTFMHWFLTDRKIHIWITMGTLTILAMITMTETFVKTSPYGHLLPPISSLPFHPITYLRESMAVVRLHIEYTTQQANESRQQKILDAQKRRLYRRAHGMENLDAEEEQGIDVRGLVPWDDGLTNKERASGGRDRVLTGRDVVDMGGRVGDDVTQFAKTLKGQADVESGSGADGAVANHEQQQQQQQQQSQPTTEAEAEAPAPQQQRKRKVWLGIW